MIWKKIVSVVLFAVVLLSLFSGWIGLGVGAKNMIFSLYDNQEGFLAALEEIIYDLADEIQSEANYGGMFFDSVKIVKSAGVIFAALVDLCLAPSEIGPLCNNAAGMLRPMLNVNYSEDAALALDVIGILGAVSTILFCIMMAFLVLIFILTFTSKKNVCGLHIIVMIMNVLGLVVTVAAVILCNRFLSEEIMFAGARLLRVTAWPYVAAICSVAGLIFYCLGRKKKVVPAVVAHGANVAARAKQVSAPADTWVCAACGAECSGAFCHKCGAKKPEPTPEESAPEDAWICSACGASCDGGAFCSACGTKRGQKKLCPACGKEIKEGDRFCFACGTKCE